MMYSVCSAENTLTLHSGVEFGMTMDEVKAAEEKNGFEAVIKELHYTDFLADGTYEWRAKDGLMVAGSIAAIDNSRIYYYSDASNRLIGAVYLFRCEDAYPFENNNARGNTNINNEYNLIQEQLEKKYSSVWEECNIDHYPKYIDGIRDKFTGVYYIPNSFRIKVSDNEYIYITHCIKFLQMGSGNLYDMIDLSGLHYLEYRYFTQDEIEKQEAAFEKNRQDKKAAQEAEEEKKQSQLDNDF